MMGASRHTGLEPDAADVFPKILPHNSSQLYSQESVTVAQPHKLTPGWAKHLGH